MKKRFHHSSRRQVAVAACTVDLAGQAPSEIRLTPAGHFRARDGRPQEIASGWLMDGELAARVITWAKEQNDDFVIDYDHQTLYTKENGQPAPAAGWWKGANMEWREGDGLYATQVQWTAAAASAIEAQEYRYISPVLFYNPKTGAVQAVIMAALTNYAALDGLDGLAVRAAAAFSLDDSLDDSLEDDTVTREQLIALLGLAANATDAQIESAMTALKTRADQVPDLETAVAALKAKQPDPAKFVPLEQFESLKGELATLRGDVTGREVEDLVKTGLSNGKLLPAQEAWAKDLGKKDVAALKAYLESTPAIAALKSTQTGGKAPEGDGQGAALTESQLAICKATGIDPAEYKKQLDEEARA